MQSLGHCDTNVANNPRIGYSWQRIPPIGLLREDLGTSGKFKKLAKNVTQTETSHGGYCAGDWCEETNHCIPKDTISLTLCGGLLAIVKKEEICCFEIQ